jgi:peptide methionine sulfoxide reductase MsrA
MKDPMIVMFGLIVLVSMGVAFAGSGGKVLVPSVGDLEKATFAGGCFWCMEPPFDKLDGVISTTSGYAGGKEKEPAYEDVASGKTGHAEAIQIVYDPLRITYAELLDVFWRNIEQRDLAISSKEALEKSGKYERGIVTEILPAAEFYPAEDYHQDYYKKNPVHYKSYRRGSGRDQFLEKAWKEKE